MARDSAQFQARSALMGVGFTTKEAEDITTHPQRRKIVLWLMTFGNAGVVTGAASMILVFVDAGASQTLRRSGLFVVGLSVMLLALHTTWANRAIESATRAVLRRYTTLDTRDYSQLLRFESDFAVMEIHARADEWMVDRPLSQLHLTREGVVVLGIHRVDGPFLGAPTGDTVIHPDDVVLAYGRAHTVAELASRKLHDGDAAHERAMAEHQRLIRKEG